MGDEVISDMIYCVMRPPGLIRREFLAKQEIAKVLLCCHLANEQIRDPRDWGVRIFRTWSIQGHQRRGLYHLWLVSE